MDAKTKVLIVDDDEVVRLSFLRSLRGDSRMVEAAADGPQALAAMERHAFDVVLLDLRMPGMDGMDVLKAIKARWPESEVVIVTAYPSVESAIEAVRRGAFDYLAKPVGPDEIIGAADSATRQKKWTLRRERELDEGRLPAGAVTRH